MGHEILQRGSRSVFLLLGPATRGQPPARTLPRPVGDTPYSRAFAKSLPRCTRSRGRGGSPLTPAASLVAAIIRSAGGTHLKHEWALFLLRVRGLDRTAPRRPHHPRQARLCARQGRAPYHSPPNQARITVPSVPGEIHLVACDVPSQPLSKAQRRLLTSRVLGRVVSRPLRRRLRIGKQQGGISGVPWRRTSPLMTSSAPCLTLTPLRRSDRWTNPPIPLDRPARKSLRTKPGGRP